MGDTTAQLLEELRADMEEEAEAERAAQEAEAEEERLAQEQEDAEEAAKRAADMIQEEKDME